MPPFQAAFAQTQPGSAGQNPAPAQEPASAQPGAQPNGDLFDLLASRATLTGDWGGLRQTLLDRGITLGLQEQSEVWGNITGGLRQGVTYDGLTTGSVKLDLEKLAGWTGGTFFVSGYQIHGRGPSANLVGNAQLVSSLEATRDTKLYDLWLQQDFWDGRLSLRIGQEGANDELMLTQYGAVFMNSSFGFPAVAAADLPSGGPNYPLATPFVRVQARVTDQVTMLAAVFNGDPAPKGIGDPQLRDRGGTAFRLNGHAFAIAEVWYAVNQADDAPGLPATYKLGMWYDSARFNDQMFDTTGVPLASPASNGVPRTHSGDYALYGIIDQMIWRKPGAKGQGLGAFLEVMGAPGGYNLSNLSIAAGLNWSGPFAGRDNDVLGVAVTYLGISPAARRYGRDLVRFSGTGFPYAASETVVEATYLFQAAQWLALQPDLQVIVNPNAGIPSAFSRVPLKNDVIAGVRATVTF